ncbi:helix-turn-helix domain-containing protein [Sphingopyxis sp.]|jgi:transcriptional regulator with XRE-family HTH domain|uniref:helix-turn-helix domain-containing protein n=1 Tax=Sphingopyxis sp. TaxID=1908224 RepID=UPI003F6FBA82
MSTGRIASGTAARSRRTTETEGTDTFAEASVAAVPARSRSPQPGKAALGTLLRAARAARGLSQMELSLRIGVSQRHLGFLEVNRSRPSRGMLLTILDALNPPRSIRNATLIAAGFGPEPLTERAGIAMSRLMQTMLDAHDPFPAVVFDSDWYARSLSAGGRHLCELLMPRARGWAGADGKLDMIDAVADPDGLLSTARDAERAAATLLAQFWTEAWARPALLDRVRACGSELEARYGPLDASPREAGAPYLQLCFDTALGPLSFSCFQSIPGLPQDVSTTSHRIELWYPDDDHTRSVLEKWAKNSGPNHPI